MDYLDPIASFDNRSRPLSAAHDLLVAFDRNSLGHQRQLADQVIQGEIVRDLACLAVDLNAQCFSLSLRQDDAPEFGNLSLVLHTNQHGGTAGFE